MNKEEIINILTINLGMTDYITVTKYLSDLEEENKKYKEVIDKAIEYIEYNDEDLYVYNPDYDYEENIVSNYDATTFREDLLDILKGADDD